MARDVIELFTPDNLWRARLNAWKTDAILFHEVGGSILVDKYIRGQWKKTPEATIHLKVFLIGKIANRVYLVHDSTHYGVGYRDWRVSHGGVIITFGSDGIGIDAPVGNVTMPESKETVRGVRASGDVFIQGYPRMVFEEACSGDFCG